MRAMLRRLTRAACISVHAPDGSHSYVAIFFILVLPNTIARSHKQKSPRAISPLMELDFDFGSAHGDGFRFCLHLR